MRELLMVNQTPSVLFSTASDHLWTGLSLCLVSGKEYPRFDLHTRQLGLRMF